MLLLNTRELVNLHWLVLQAVIDLNLIRLMYLYFRYFGTHWHVWILVLRSDRTHTGLALSID